MTSTIDSELAQSFVDASAALIDRVRQAIRAFRAAPPEYQAAWELRSTPTAWETRVLTNLHEYHDGVQAALRAYHNGDIEPITLEAASYKGLSKDLDGYRLDWMTEQNRVAVEDAIRQVVRVANRIHHLGDDELTRMGR
jgi:hypothetical protein